MNALREIINAVSSNQSGHWGIVAAIATESVDQNSASFQDLKGDRQVNCLHVRCGVDGKLLNVDSEVCLEPDKLYDQLRLLVIEAKAAGRSIVRCIVTHFESLSIENQCLILRGSRAARDETANFTIQTIIIGAWNFFRLQDYWKKNLHNLSPAPDRKHIFFQSCSDGSDIKKKLCAAGIISEHSNHFDDVCIDILAEATGGDNYILNFVISSLSIQHQRIDAIESTLAHAADSGELADEFRRRGCRLNSEAWEILDSILHHQFVSRPERDVHAEDLRLGGFIKVRAIGNQNSLALNSPLLERILREKWAFITSGRLPVYNGCDLARPSLALNTAAYRLIAQIENTLRNLVVLSLSENSVWTKRLDSVKTLAHDGGPIANELLGLAREIQNVLRPFGGGTEAPTPIEQPVLDPADPQSHATKKQKQVAIIEAAKDWRQRNATNTVLELSGDSLIYFFTTEGLSSVLVNEKQDVYPTAVKRFFPNKHELATFLEHYVAIRAAVAHNQPINLSTLKRLDTMRDDLEKRICQVL